MELCTQVANFRALNAAHEAKPYTPRVFSRTLAVSLRTDRIIIFSPSIGIYENLMAQAACTGGWCSSPYAYKRPYTECNLVYPATYDFDGLTFSNGIGIPTCALQFVRITFLNFGLEVFFPLRFTPFPANFKECNANKLVLRTFRPTPTLKYT